MGHVFADSDAYGLCREYGLWSAYGILNIECSFTECMLYEELRFLYELR